MSSFAQIIAKCITYFLYVLPRPVQLWLGRCLGILWFDVFRIRRKVVVSNIKLAYPNWTERECIRVGRESVIGVCQTLVEFGIIFHFKPQEFNKYFVVENLQDLDQEYKKGKGVIILSLHTGNGDLGGAALAEMGYKVNLISKHFKSKWLDDVWFGIRAQRGIKFISHEKSTFDILRALKKGEIVIFVLDQFMGPPVGVRTRFFGVETGTAMGLALFAQKSGAPVVPVYDIRRKDGRHAIFAEPKIPFEERADQDENIKYMTQKYTDQIEKVVRKEPEQWMWLHRRWKKFND